MPNISYPTECEDWISSSKSPLTTLSTAPPEEKGRDEKSSVTALML